jgi:mono/diheme cytochrome c family protein
MRADDAERREAILARIARAGRIARRALPELVAISFLLIPSPSRADPKLAPMAAAGREEFTTYCVSCHGRTGVGDGVAAPALKKRPADLTRIAARRGGSFPDDEIAAIIDGRSDVMAHGTRDMPVWGERFGDDANDSEREPVTQGRVALLVAYLKVIQVEVPETTKGDDPR